MFKKPINPTSRPSPAPTSATPDSTTVERRIHPRPLPLPEVIEGSGGESEWAMWLEHAEQLARLEDPKRDAPDSAKPGSNKSGTGESGR